MPFPKSLSFPKSLFRRGPGRIGAAEARRRTDDGASVLLDVREPSEWHTGHAPGAVHLPLSVLVDGAPLPAPGALPVVVICRSGNRSRQAARILVDRGVPAVDVIGGMTAWAAAGFPVRDHRGNAGTVA
ncbi:rhodanese-like domain-containing protein [Streptomyces sp. NPDC050529]|uniref:rhodanese-like domain-containing protein n=1 Tax=unclassified Streptomyces TaxID=2593676 RepID=UPI002DD8553B|nr:rhodanese-like domain-containing protein [Streptomyces sp. NBC_01022]WRZ79013.1 rhodanese-like domain-containing protein [Streptomyces sp. NBC_01022]WRZ86666.1 rhodanese-like domain-containing protein [Streptomyces sp. NBC_01022]